MGLSGTLHVLCRLDQWPDTRHLANAPGVYELVVLDKAGEWARLDRVGGTDRRGILYIGQSSKLRSRLQDLRRVIREQSPDGHIAGLTYRNSAKIKKLAPNTRIRFRYVHCGNCRREEKDLLRSYFDKYGEVPPLNAQAGFISGDQRRKRR